MNGRTNSTNGNQTDIDITKSPFATLPPSSITAVRGNQKVDIGWTNPVTEMATPGDYVVAKRAYTLVLRNEDHFPTDRSDGVEIYRDTNTAESSKVTFSDTGLTNGKNYYYGLISVTDNDIPSDVGTTQNVPSGGLLHTGVIESLTNDGYWMGYDNAPIAVADDTYAIVPIRYSSGGFDSNVNAYNAALVKTVFPLEGASFPTYSPSYYGDFIGQPVGPYGVFFGANGIYSSGYISYYLTWFSYDKNLTVTKFVHTRGDLTGIDPIAAPINDGALFYSSQSGTNIYNALWDYIDSNLTHSSPNIAVTPRATTGMATLDSITALGPGYTKMSQYDDALKSMDIVTNNLTKLSTLTVSASVSQADIYLASTKNHIIYSPGFSAGDLDLRYKVYAYTENLTESLLGDLPVSFEESSNEQHGVSFGEYALLFSSYNLACAYDQFLTQTIPAAPTVSCRTFSAGVINNHLLLTSPIDSMDVDVYSL